MASEALRPGRCPQEALPASAPPCPGHGPARARLAAAAGPPRRGECGPHLSSCRIRLSSCSRMTFSSLLSGFRLLFLPQQQQQQHMATASRKLPPITDMAMISASKFTGDRGAASGPLGRSGTRQEAAPLPRGAALGTQARVAASVSVRPSLLTVLSTADRGHRELFPPSRCFKLEKS